jgi:hypothetical protein
MSRHAAAGDPRWEGVQLPSLWRVLVRVHGEADASSHYQAAVEAIKADRKYGEWAAVMKPGTEQIIGYRRINPKEWYTRNESTGTIRGPFSTKRLALSALREKSASKAGSGIYRTPQHAVFTRDRATALGLTEEELPL